MKLPVKLLARAAREFNKSPDEIRAIQEHIASESAVQLDGIEHVERRGAMLAATARENVADAFERYLGSNDLLPINYLLAGYLQARSVGRLRYFDTQLQKSAYATGFMVTPELLMTNHHVLPVTDLAGFSALIEDAAVEFGYEFDLDGRMEKPRVFALDPAAFLYTNEELDLALVAVSPSDTSGTFRVSNQGYLVLNGTLGKTGLGDYATIIQHPDGRDQQIALRNNEIIDTSLPAVLIYKSDTAHGSSGAPVFNNEWQVIALHSAGVPKQNARGEYLDDHDQVIPPVNGAVDSERIVWISNRGIRVSTIMQHLRAAPPAISLHPMVQALFSPAYTDSRPFMALSWPQPEGDSTSSIASAPVPAAAPALFATSPAALAGAGIDIRISIRADGSPVVTATRGAAMSPAPLLEEEVKVEEGRDYARCEGYLEDFMGVHIPMPTPSAQLRKQLAFRVDSPGSSLLKYFHYTSMQHALRRVPVVRAINVQGRHRYTALGRDSRIDNWVRDNRIDIDAQLNDDWYARSGFDRGHLSRREDAEWGSTMAAAKRAADFTCSYANAIPQVPALNRAIFGYHGLWGTLEAKLLEAGVEKETGKSARICVFGGPLFKDDDPVFKAVQVALDCFKVVVWYDGNGKLRTTCFRLSQEDLVGQVEFEVLRFDQVFKTYQCPLAQIEAWTRLKFAAVMHQGDTSSGGVEPFDEVMLERLVKKPRHNPK